jgi:uncharacterized membrane protein YdjX (TVP38/TMEM64 family)
VRRFLPLFVVIAALVAFFALDLKRYLTWETLADHREWLLQIVSQLGLLAPVAFIALYAALAAVSIPLGTVLTLASGFLFGTWLGGVCSLVAATLGGSAIFLIASTSIGEVMRQRAGPALHKVEAGFQENAASYLFILRIVPLFPFWFVNLVPAFFGMRLRTFATVSFFGMAPGSFVYSSLGAGAGALIEQGKTPDVHIIFQPRVLLPLLALAVLSLVPAVYKWQKRRQRAVP